MVRGSAHVWKAARQNVQGLPEPFPGMSEPVFASLCFEPVCTVSQYGLPETKLNNWAFGPTFCFIFPYSCASSRAYGTLFGNSVLGCARNARRRGYFYYSMASTLCITQPVFKGHVNHIQ